MKHLDSSVSISQKLFSPRNHLVYDPRSNRFRVSSPTRGSNGNGTKSTSAWTSGRGLVATHYNASVDERKEHSWPTLGCAPAVPQWLVKAFAFHFVPLYHSLSLSLSPSLCLSRLFQLLFSRININATSSTPVRGFCSSSAPGERHPPSASSTLNADALPGPFFLSSSGTDSLL